MEIIIIGIGSADFSGMKFLDDNSGDIDNVQCGELNKHKSDPNSLSSATLDEIPNQLEKYFVRHNIMPNPPVQIEEDEIDVAPEEEEFDLNIDFGAGGDPVGVSGGNGVFVPSY